MDFWVRQLPSFRGWVGGWAKRVKENYRAVSEVGFIRFVQSWCAVQKKELRNWASNSVKVISSVSWISILSAWAALLFICGFFQWRMRNLSLGVLLLVFVVSAVLFEVILARAKRYALAFWLFVMSEVLIFASLFWGLFWLCDESASLGSPNGYALVGSCLLLFSSLTATNYHANYGTKSATMWWGVTIFVGSCFLLIQLCEFYNNWTAFEDWSGISVQYALVTLHFLHVLGGVVVMSLTRYLGVWMSFYHVSLVVWYWHLVDFVWLLVYLCVYVL